MENPILYIYYFPKATCWKWFGEALCSQIFTVNILIRCQNMYYS